MSFILPKVLVITDSLGFPRDTPELVRYDETWIAILKRRFNSIDFIHCGRGGATIRELFQHSFYYHTTLQPALVLIQSGIVDCAPRALTVIEQQVIQRLPIVGAYLSSLARRYAPYLRRRRRISFTSPPAFEDYIGDFEKAFESIYWIGILPADDDYEKKINGITEAIGKYNAKLRERCFIPTDDFDRGDIMSDFHHLSVAGHQRLAVKIAEVINRKMFETETS